MIRPPPSPEPSPPPPPLPRPPEPSPPTFADLPWRVTHTTLAGHTLLHPHGMHLGVSSLPPPMMQALVSASSFVGMAFVALLVIAHGRTRAPRPIRPASVMPVLYGRLPAAPEDNTSTEADAVADPEQNDIELPSVAIALPMVVGRRLPDTEATPDSSDAAAAPTPLEVDAPDRVQRGDGAEDWRGRAVGESS